MKSIKTKKTFVLTLLLSAILFWIGLGVGDNMSDFKFWIDSTWSTIKLEWFFIVIYIGFRRRLPPFHYLWAQHKFITLVAILWLATVSLSYITSPYYSWQNSLAAMRYMETVSHFIFFLFLWDFFTHYSVNYRMIFTAIILSTLVIIGYFIYIHFTFPYLEADDLVFSMRSEQLVFNTHLHRIGYQVEATIAFTTAFLFSRKQNYLAFILIGVLFVFLLWLGGRAAILGSMLTIIICLFYFWKSISPKILIVFGIFTAVLLSVVLYFQLLNLEYFVHAIQKTLHAGSFNHLLTGRIEVWSLVLQELKGHWLLGTGPQSYFFYLGRHSEVIHAHNFILQFLGEWGIIGSILFFILLYHAIVSGIRKNIKQSAHIFPFQFSALLVIFSLTVTGLFSGIYFFQQSEIYLTLAFAIITTPIKKRFPIAPTSLYGDPHTTKSMISV